MRRRRRFVKRIDRYRPEYAELYGKRLLERRAAFWLGDILRERRPRQRETCAFGLGRGALRFGAADRGDAAFAARDALRRFVQIADRAFAADRPVIGVLRLDAEAAGELLLRVAVAPAQEIDDVERSRSRRAAGRPSSASARLSASTSRASGSRPCVISFGRSTISPTPTMTGMRSSGRGTVVMFCFSLAG